MLILTIALMTVSTDTDQILAGKTFEAFAARTDVACPTRHIRAITPGDLDLVQEDFARDLPARAATRLQSTNDADRQCAGHNGLACPTTHTLAAIRRIGLLGRFTGYICQHMGQ